MNQLPLSSLLAQYAQRDAQLTQIVDQALADATLRAGYHLVCRPGCTQCCHGAFAISPLDALRLRTAMVKLHIDRPELASEITGRAARYLEEFGPGFPGDRQTGILGVSEEDQAAFEDFANDAPCPALNPSTGLCEVYTARPMTCRTFGPPVRMAQEPAEGEGLAVCELCFTEATPDEIAAAEMIVPRAEEQQLISELQAQPPDSVSSPGDTIVAYCLISPPAR